MPKHKLRMNRRAVSPIIATLLLVAIAVAAAVVTYTWVMSMAANQSQQSQTSIKIDQVLFGQSTTDNGISVTVRNTGSIAATIQTIYIFQGDKFIVSAEPGTTNGTIAAGSVKSIGLTDATGWTSALTSGGVALPTPNAVKASLSFNDDLVENTPYLVRILTTTGFVAEGTYYTPGSF